MRIYVDLDSLDLVNGPSDRGAVTELNFKRGTQPAIQLQFVRGGSPELLPLGTAIRFGPKQDGKYDGDFIVFTDDFTAPEDATGFYTARPSFNTDALNDLLFSPDGNEDNDLPEVTLMSEFSWRLGSALPEKSKTFAVVVANAVDNGDETAPSEAGPSLDTRISSLESRVRDVDGLALMMPAVSDTAMAVIVDEFTRADTALGGVGKGWVDPGSKWEVDGNAVRCSTGAYNVDLLARLEQFAEPKVTAIVEYKNDGTINQSAAVWIRKNVGAVNGYATWLTTSGGNPKLAIGKFAAGSPTFSTLTVGSLTAASFYVLTIQAIGNRITATVATVAAPTVILGKLVLVDSEYTTGQIALSPLVINGQVQSITIEDRASAPLVVCDGNSMTEGYLVSAASAYPAQLAGLLGTGWNVVNLGVSAQTTAAMVADAAAEVDVLYRAVHRKNVAIVWEGTNHLFFGADTQTALAMLKAYCSERRRAGFRVIVMTVTPRSEVGTPVDFAANRTIVNAELRDITNLGVYWDAVYDVAADSRFADETNTTYFSDLVHMTPAGYAIVAAGLAAVIAGMVND